MENTPYNKIEMEFELIAFFNSIGIDNIYKGTKEPELQKEYRGENFVFKSETSHHLQTDIDLNKIKKALNNKYDFELKKDKFLKWDIFLLEQLNYLDTFAKESPQIQKDYFKLIESCKRAINEVKRLKKATQVNKNLTLKDIAKPEYYEKIKQVLKEKINEIKPDKALFVNYLRNFGAMGCYTEKLNFNKLKAIFRNMYNDEISKSAFSQSKADNKTLKSFIELEKRVKS